MSCPSIQGLVLDEGSKRAVEEIRSKGQIAKAMGSAMSFGVLANIFNSGYSLIASFNIYQTDFQSYAKAMAGVSAVHKRTVAFIASQQELRSLDYKQRAFWKAVREGCN
jgi:hypothetical protein